MRRNSNPESVSQMRSVLSSHLFFLGGAIGASRRSAAISTTSRRDSTKLCFAQPRVPPATRDQLLVRAALDDASLIEHQDLVGMNNRRKPVGNDDGRSVGRLRNANRAFCWTISFCLSRELKLPMTYTNDSVSSPLHSTRCGFVACGLLKTKTQSPFLFERFHLMLSSNRCIPYLKNNASEAVANMPNGSYESGRKGCASRPAISPDK